MPWGNYITYYDEEAAGEVRIEYTPGEEDWKGLWTAFLNDFMAHSKEKGWFDITYISQENRLSVHADTDRMYETVTALAKKLC